MSRGDWSILLVLALFWGSSYLLNKIALPGFPVFTLVFVRVALAGGLLWFVLHLLGKPLPRGWKVWAALLGLALMNTVVPLSLFSAAQTTLSVSLTSILNGMTPIMAVITAHFMTTDERATPGRIIGVLFGFAGLVTVIGAEALYGLGGHLMAQAACIVATLSNALAGIYGRRFTGLGVDPLALATSQLLLSALVLLPVSLIVDAPWTLPMPGLSSWLAMLALTLFSTALAFFLFFRLLARVGVTNAFLVTFLLPIVAMVEGVLILGEPVAPQHLLGLALITVGLVAVDGRLPRKAWLAMRPNAA